MTSFISFIVLLLATYSYSLPLGQLFENTTPEYEFTTGHTIVDHENTFNMHLISEEESANVSNIHTKHYYGVEATTEAAEHDLRSVESFSFTTPVSMTQTTFPSLEENDRHHFDGELFTTMETKTAFNARAIRPVRPVEDEEEFESSTNVESSTFEPSTSESSSFESSTSEPSSSFESFGKATGLLHEDHTEESSTSVDYDHHEYLNEKSTIRVPVKSQRLTKTVAILPGRITETKIYSNTPIKTYIVPQTQQLRQGQMQSVYNKEESDQ